MGSGNNNKPFYKKRTPEELKDFFTLMKEAPVIGESKPYHLDVGYFEVDKNHKFTFHTCEGFDLRE